VKPLEAETIDAHFTSDIHAMCIINERGCKLPEDRMATETGFLKWVWFLFSEKPRVTIPE